MACGVCGKEGHNVKTCPYDGPRIAVERESEKSKRCRCCGQYGYDITEHHTEGRSNPYAYLDVCYDCHLTCCHGGDFRNLGIKPRKCQVLNRKSYWI